MVSQSCKGPVSPKPWFFLHYPLDYQTEPSVPALTLAGVILSHCNHAPWVSLGSPLCNPAAKAVLAKCRVRNWLPHNFSGPKCLCSAHCPPGSSHDVLWCAWKTADVCVSASVLAAPYPGMLFLHGTSMGLSYKKLSWDL